jgi:hypothetical protein
VIVGRVGASGLVLQALGITAFDSGLGQAEAHDLATLNRPMTERERQRRAEGKAVEARSADLPRAREDDVRRRDRKCHPRRHRHSPPLHVYPVMLSLPGLRGHRGTDPSALPLDASSGGRSPSQSRLPAMRVTHVESQLRAAKDTAVVVRRVLQARRQESRLRPP